MRPAGAPVDEVPAPASNAPERDPSYDQRQQIRDAFADAREGFRECYELVLLAQPELDDRLVVELSVTPDPEDPELTVSELIAITSEEMDVVDIECFAGEVERLEMPPSPDGEPYTMRYPVTLTTGESGGRSGDAASDAGLSSDSH